MAPATIFDNALYQAARASRLKNLFEHVPSESFQGKAILETGSGTGELGEAFVRLGCRVVSVDARSEHIAVLRERFPTREAHVGDLSDGRYLRSLGLFDAVLSFGLLYHLPSPAEFLEACAAVAPELYIETVVSDSLEAICPRVEEELSWPDQAAYDCGSRPSPPWLYRELNNLGYEVRDISTATANWGEHAPSTFDWIVRGDGTYLRDGARLRKMLVCTHRK